MKTRVVHVKLHSRKYPGLFAIVDEADADLVNQHRWNPVRRKTGWHAQTVINVDGHRRYVYMHHLLVQPTANQQVDHRDCNGLNNTRNNLRSSTQQNNVRNQRRRSDNRSGFKGVSWSRQKRRWRTVIVTNGKQQHLGHFDVLEDAARAYDAEARRTFGEFARLNFPMKGEQSA